MSAWILAAQLLTRSANLFPEPAASPEPGQVPSANARALTLDDSVRAAISNGTTVLKAEYAERYTGAQLLQAYGQFLPNLVASGTCNYTTGTTYSTLANPAYVVGSGPNAGYTITTDLNLFNGISDYASLTSALLKNEASRLSVFRAKQQIKLDVLQGYYQVVLDHWLEDIAKANLEVSHERERLFAAEVKVGSRHLSDLFQQQAQTAAQELQLLSIRDKTLADQLALLKKIRLDVTQGYRFLEPPLHGENEEPVPKDEKSLLEVALARRVDLRSSTDLTEAGQWDVRAARGAYLPRLDLYAGLSSAAHYLDSLTVNGAGAVPVVQNGLAYQLGQQIEYTAGIQLSWAVFDRFLTSQTVSRLQTAYSGAQLDLWDLKNSVESDVRQAYGNYRTVLQQLRTSDKGVVAARSSFKVLAGRYGVGGVNLLDLLTAQEVLIQAESSYAQALIAFQLQTEALRFATGEMTVEP
jgi:outer membrane protein